MTTLAEVSQSPVPEGVFEQFEGRWIAIRDEQVVADAPTIEELTADANVQESDMFMFVPPKDSSFF